MKLHCTQHLKAFMLARHLVFESAYSYLLLENNNNVEIIFKVFVNVNYPLTCGSCMLCKCGYLYVVLQNCK